MKMVIEMIEPALVLTGEIVAAIPLLGGLGPRARGQQAQSGHAHERGDGKPVGNHGDGHRVAQVSSGRVEVSAIDHALEGELDDAASAQHLIPDIGGRLSLLHPHALLDEGISAGEGPHRGHGLQSEGLEESVALGSDGAAGPAVGAQLEALAEIADHLLYLGHHQMTAERGLESGHQEAVVTARERPRHGARSEAAHPVGAEPFPRFRRPKIARHLSAEANEGHPVESSMC